MNRRQFLGSATGFTASALAGTSKAGQSLQSAPAGVKPKKKRRTMYFNDARHFYLYSFEPPMSLEDARRPVDELAGTAVNTLIYGVETAGLFSDTKVGIRAGSDQRPFTSANGWR